MCWFLKINPVYAANANQISWFLLDNSTKIFHQKKTETDIIYTSTEGWVPSWTDGRMTHLWSCGISVSPWFLLGFLFGWFLVGWLAWGFFVCFLFLQ